MLQSSGIAFATAYVDDYSKALAFYQKHLGFVIKFPMGEKASWGKIGELGLYLEGGNAPAGITAKTVRASVVFAVPSAYEFFKQLKDDDVPLLQPEPQHMGEGDYWFQFRDPSGNILEALGGK